MFGDTVLHNAIMVNSDAETVAILTNNGADINTRNKEGVTPLHIAVQKDNVEVAKLLTENGINVIRIGLKSNEMIKGDSYHPAFGQLVKSSVMLDEITERLDALGGPPKGLTVIITAVPSEINFAAGHKGMNKKILQSRYPGVRFRFEKGDAFGVRAE